MSSVTLVTAFYRLDDRPVDVEAMFRRFDALTKCGLPIVLFLEPELVDSLLEKGYSNVLVVPIPLREVWPFNYIESRPLPAHRTPEKDTRGFLLLQNAKVEFLRRAVGMSTANKATHFAWIDFGIMKVVRDPEIFRERLRALTPPATCVLAPGCHMKPSKLIMEPSKLLPPEDVVCWRFCGGFLLVDRESVEKLAALHRAAFHRASKLTWEVNIWAQLEREGLGFDWYPADHDDSLLEIPPQMLGRGSELAGSFKVETAPRAKRVCLVMIVKNESKIMQRCLTAALPFIDTWVITDTGSTDGTPELIRNFFELCKIPGKIFEAPFLNFAQARNMSLANARRLSGWDYALLIDADMVLRGTLDKNILSAGAYKIRQVDGSLVYQNTRLLRRTNIVAQYIGVTHEFLSVDVDVEELSTLMIDDRNDGGSKGNKAERDIRLLVDGLAKEPKNERYMFYLANTYREQGRSKEAIEWYEKRIERGGWEEEVWFSYYGIAWCYRDLMDTANMLKAALEAYNFRPTRGEPLKMLAKYFREKSQNEIACLFADRLLELEQPPDQLFVEHGVYDFGADEEHAIAGYYSKLPYMRDRGYRACADLTLHPREDIRAQARKNFTFYARSAKEMFGAETREIDWHPTDGYAPMNPSVCVVGDRKLVLVRTVNYTVTAEGQYPTLDGSGIIRTRNHVLEMDEDWRPVLSTFVEDTTGTPRTAFPVEGFEDCRLWHANERYFASATVRDRTEGGQCEIAILELDQEWRAINMRICDYERGRPQKNWMPVLGEGAGPRGDGLLQFLYLCDPTIVIDCSLKNSTRELARSTLPVSLVDLRGGSQVIPHQGGWLCITHEVAWRPERVYLHRFVQLGDDFRIIAISDPFYFQRIGIEFCAGLARDGDRFVASFGVNDASAHLVFFDPEAVDRKLISV